MNYILENSVLVLWICTLFMATRISFNFNYVLLCLLIPKLIDVLFLTPVLTSIEHTEYRHIAYPIHSLNDLLTIGLLIFRERVTTAFNFLSRIKLAKKLKVRYGDFRRFSFERYLIAIYIISIVVNFLVLYEVRKYHSGIDTSLYFRSLYPTIKSLFGYIEALLLTVISIDIIYFYFKTKHELQKNLIKDNANGSNKGSKK